jgi:ubiquinone/menaquinone biosynthesis C-methylase UbiE
MDSLPADRRDDVCLTLADISPNMVDAARAKAEDKGWKVSSVQTVDMQVRDRKLLVWHSLSDS